MKMWWKLLALLAGWFGISTLTYAQVGPPPMCNPIMDPAAGVFPPMSPPPSGNMLQYSGIPEVNGPIPGLNMAAEDALVPQEGALPNTRFFASAEYVRWFLKHRQIPALLTRGSGADPVPGALDQLNTTILLNDTFPGGGGANGVRGEFGFWLDPLQTFSISANFFALEEQNPVQLFSTDGGANSPFLSRPYFNVVVQQQFADPVAVPDVLAGSIVFSYLQRMYGSEVNFRWVVENDTLNESRLSLLFGGRLLALDERLRVTSKTTILPQDPVNGDFFFQVNEDFTTTNRFYGGQIGGIWEYSVGPARLELIGKVAVGQTRQVVTIKGSTELNDPLGQGFVVSQNAVLAGPGNIGRYEREELAVVPELALNLN